jgi:hypothetical protein
MKKEISLPLGPKVALAHAQPPFTVTAFRQDQKMVISDKVSGIMSVTVTDALGRKVSGLPITFQLVQGSGTFTTRLAETNDAGWVHTILLPTKCGEHIVLCKVAGESIEFTCLVESDAAPKVIAAPGAAVTPPPTEPPQPLPMFTLDNCQPVRPERISGETPLPTVTPARLPNLTPHGIPAMADDGPDGFSVKEELAELKGNRKALIALIVCLVVGALIGIVGYRIFTARDIPAGEIVDCRGSSWTDSGDKLVYKQCVVKRR